MNDKQKTVNNEWIYIGHNMQCNEKSLVLWSFEQESPMCNSSANGSVSLNVVQVTRSLNGEWKEKKTATISGTRYTHDIVQPDSFSCLNITT